jgi:hypothetical protein
LEQAELDARPVIVETVKGTKDEKVQRTTQAAQFE